jgi:hypothetical protein
MTKLSRQGGIALEKIGQRAPLNLFCSAAFSGNEIV